MSTQAARVVELVETATGDRYQVRREKTPAQSYGRRFMLIWNEQVAELAAKLECSHSARVLLVLMNRLDFRCWRRLTQQEVAETLAISQSAVSRSLCELEKAGAIERRGKATVIEWRLSRSIGYRGTAAQFHADERNDRMCKVQEVVQPALKLGPMRVVKGGKKPQQHPPH